MRRITAIVALVAFIATKSMSQSATPQKASWEPYNSAITAGAVTALGIIVTLKAHRSCSACRSDPNQNNMPKNTFFLAPGTQKFLIFNKRNDGTIAKTYQITGKAGKRA